MNDEYELNAIGATSHHIIQPAGSQTRTLPAAPPMRFDNPVPPVMLHDFPGVQPQYAERYFPSEKVALKLEHRPQWKGCGATHLQPPPSLVITGPTAHKDVFFPGKAPYEGQSAAINAESQLRRLDYSLNECAKNRWTPQGELYTPATTIKNAPVEKQDARLAASHMGGFNGEDDRRDFGPDARGRTKFNNNTRLFTDELDRPYSTV